MGLVTSGSCLGSGPAWFHDPDTPRITTTPGKMMPRHTESSTHCTPAAPCALAGTEMGSNRSNGQLVRRRPQKTGAIRAASFGEDGRHPRRLGSGKFSKVCLSSFRNLMTIPHPSRVAPALVAVLSAFSLSSCDSPEGRGAVYGATAGAIVGNLVNPQASTTLRGAAIGAGAGALIGALVGDSSRDYRYYDRNPGYHDYYADRYREGYYPRPEQGYPYGTPTGDRNFVRSPYRPYNVIDVSGIPRGALVVDPSTDRVFRRP